MNNIIILLKAVGILAQYSGRNLYFCMTISQALGLPPPIPDLKCSSKCLLEPCFPYALYAPPQVLDYAINPSEVLGAPDYIIFDWFLSLASEFRSRGGRRTIQFLNYLALQSWLINFQVSLISVRTNFAFTIDQLSSILFWMEDKTCQIVKKGGRVLFGSSKQLCWGSWNLHGQKQCGTGLAVRRSVGWDLNERIGWIQPWVCIFRLVLFLILYCLFGGPAPIFLVIVYFAMLIFFLILYSRSFITCYKNLKLFAEFSVLLYQSTSLFG